MVAIKLYMELKVLALSTKGVNSSLYELKYPKDPVVIPVLPIKKHDKTVYLSDEYEDGEKELYYELGRMQNRINKWFKYNCVWDEDTIEYVITNMEEVKSIKDYIN